MTKTDSKSIINDMSLVERIRAIRLVAFDFDGVFTDNTVYVSEDGTEMVRCFRGDGLGLNKLKQAGIKTIIISPHAVASWVSVACTVARTRAPRCRQSPARWDWP
jgi:hypothetical protein